jgi:hypothetical protein
MSDTSIPKAKNLTAQLHYAAEGNPPSTRPDSAISNCFPGLEFDFRNIWRRAFDGIELNESDNLVVAADQTHREFQTLRKLVGHRLLYVDHQSTFVRVNGPRVIGGPENEPLPDSTNDTWVMEWSNSLAAVLRKAQGRFVSCWFTTGAVNSGTGIVSRRRKGRGLTPPGKLERMPEGLVSQRLRVNALFEPSTAVIAEGMVRPGELTQSLCSPWQNDYKECACYYWAASRPDYVNTELVGPGETIGNSWLAKSRDPKEYLDDDSSRLWSYDELFEDWQGRLKFIIGGKDAD